MSIVLHRPVATEQAVVDLHLHSDASDGDDGGLQLADRCRAAGVRVAACTDHDTLAGYDRFRPEAEAAGITVIAGTEVTARWGEEEVHCLAYFLDPDDLVFRDRLREVRDAELGWWRTWFEQAEALGVEISWQAMQERFGADRVAYLGDYLDAFLTAAGTDARFSGYERGGRHDKFIAQWCKDGQPLHVPHCWRPDLAEVTSWISQSGGVAVLAHPGRLAGEPEEIVKKTTDLGIAGLEVWTTWHDPDVTVRFLEACDAHGPIPTQGSDYHGARLKPWAPTPGLVPLAAPDPMAIVDALYARRP